MLIVLIQVTYSSCGTLGYVLHQAELYEHEGSSQTCFKVESLKNLFLGLAAKHKIASVERDLTV